MAGLSVLRIAFGLVLVIMSCNGPVSVKSKVSQAKYHCLLDKIGPADTLLIRTVSQGCFGHGIDSILIFRQSDSFFASFSFWGSLMSDDSDSFVSPLIRPLADSSLQAYAQFEAEGKVLKTTGGCTTSKDFLISLNGESIHFEDNDCSYKGDDILLDKLFGKAYLYDYLMAKTQNYVRTIKDSQ